MKLSQLIDALVLAQEQAGDHDPEVFIAYQPQYPLYTKIVDVTTPHDVKAHTDSYVPVEDQRSVFILSDYSDVGFAPKCLWDVRD
jgi:hypothetical protein